ncbi:MAG: hypothetical protein ACOCX2_08100 [Armatimonadota bacterium]
MHTLRIIMIVMLIAGTVAVCAAQAETTLTGVAEYLQSLDYPESLSLRLTGVFRSTDFETYAQMTLDPFADLSVIGQWTLLAGERYDYELSLSSDGDWALHSLALSVLGQAAAKSTTAAPAPEMGLTGSFIARYGGMIFPHYEATGEAERDVTVRLATLTLPDPSRFHPVETEDRGLKLARLDVLEFVNACEQLGGEAVLTVSAPEGSLAQLWTVGYPEEAVTLPISERVGTRTLPPAPWAVRIRLPAGMTVDDLPGGQVGLDLDAEGILPDWLGPRTNPAR